MSVAIPLTWVLLMSATIDGEEGMKLTPGCALAIYASMNEFMNSTETGRHQVSRFTDDFGEIYCREMDGVAEVTFYPSDDHQRGGDVRYVVNLETLHIEAVMPGR